MKIRLISIGSSRARRKRENEDILVEDYVARTNQFANAVASWVADEQAFWAAVETFSGRVRAQVILMDSRGAELSSTQFASAVGAIRDGGAQQLVFGIGGADGWTEMTRRRADMLISLGRMTLPHSLARVVTAEQIYRAMTILAGHPYHSGH